MRLNAYLARAGVASRRNADELIKAGRVTVNGEPGQLNTFVAANDLVEVDGERVSAQGLAYVLLHKPGGTVTTAHDPQGRPTVVDLVDVSGARRAGGPPRRRHDGRAAAHERRAARAPARASEVRGGEGLRGRGGGEPDDAALQALAEGVELEDGATAPATVRCLAPSRIELTLHEGRNRQVKRMLEAVGHPVRRLHRSRYAGLTLEGLEPGAWRRLEPSEVERLRTMQREPRRR